ncbi:MAG: ferrous iron transporter B [Clostridia bacterium]|nr:ferrous iron transporter B [Clostridia bacterium]
MTRAREKRLTAALIGNPNVGKSTVFNALTGLNRHTGNWTGKTVDLAAGTVRGTGGGIELVDLPGCYSLTPTSPEEEAARDLIAKGAADCTVVVCDASCLERNLNIVLQTLRITRRVVVCVNLIDEAAKRGISVDVKRLGALLGVEAVAASAVKKQGLKELVRAIRRAAEVEEAERGRITAAPMWAEAERIAALVVTRDSDARSARFLKLDRLLTGRVTGAAVMLALLALVLFLTMVGANLPSRLLGEAFSALLGSIRLLLQRAGMPALMVSMICDGGLATLMTVVSVMLPPMAIFFPLFTLLEDLGLLPRIAFDLDSGFRRCGGCGKQALTCCMGFGCNAAGVIGCRIIESPRERLIAILTNSLIPCNGRFPTLTALITMFFAAGMGGSGGAVSALIMTGLILLSLAATFLASKLLTITVLKGKPSSFVLELPPFRTPRVGKIIVRSVLDRTLFVLGRAAAAALPAGILIWALANAGETPPLGVGVRLLDPVGAAMGVDGAILMAFILGLPANELVMPLLVMIYSGAGTFSGMSLMRDTLIQNGWSVRTALCVMLLMLFHSPCATTLLTVRRETGSPAWTAAAFLIPSAIGVLLCLAVNGIWTLAGMLY